MTILVTGATGLIGKRLVRALIEAGHTVTAVSRDAARAARALPVRCRSVAWNPDGTLAPDVVRGVDAVIHLAGEGVADGRWSAARKQSILQSRVNGSRALVQAIASLPEAERPRVLVAASAIGYYGDRGDELLDEQSPAGRGFLAEVCEAWEREVFAASHLGVRTAAVRIGIVLDTNGGALARMLPPFRLGAGGRLGSGTQWMSWIHLGDLVQLFLHVLENPQASGPINGVAPTPVTNAKFTAELGRVLHRPTLLPAPAVALRLALGEMSALLFDSQRVLPRAAERLGFAFRYPQLAGALANLCAFFGREMEQEQLIARPPDEVFAFFSDPHNLEKITPDFLRFRVLDVTPPDLRQGTLINHRLSLHGLPVRWQSRIDVWDPPRRFVDVQTRGPYKRWQHTHEFEPYDGGTLIRDRVQYELPAGVLGSVIGGPLVARDLQTIFNFRREQIVRLLSPTGAKNRSHV